MVPGPDLPWLSMVALISALMLFAALLLFGIRIVRWLKLPQDLPEGPRFEPPPPPTVPRGDRATAAVAAANQARLRAVYAEAFAVAQAAAECQGLHQQVVSAGAVEPYTAAAAITGPHATAAHASAKAVETALDAFTVRVQKERAAIGDAEITAMHQLLAEHSRSVQSALAQVRSAIAPLPDGGNRRLILLVVLLVLMILWVVIMKMLLNK